MGFINHVSPLCTFGGLRERESITQFTCRTC
jgi:hypothetical protein